VIGFYLLTAFGQQSPLGQFFQSLLGRPLAFSFEGLVLASVLVNLPFAVQPMQNALAAIPANLRDAARCCGLAPLSVVRRIELPLALPGIATAVVLTFAHTLGEFGVVLMVGGSIPGETRTIAIAIYDRVQAFDDHSAGVMALVLLVLSLVALGITNTLARRMARHD
jgi:molybdate transport system permease protein